VAPKVSLIANFDELPFQDGSVDVLYLPHLLEFFNDPRPILAEVARILSPAGKVIILNFNPAGLWGVTRILRKFVLPLAKKPPWSLHFHSRVKLSRLLSERELFVQEHTSAFYRPPISHPYWLEKLGVLEVLGRFSWPEWGASYFCVATKKELPLTLQRAASKEKELVPEGAFDPLIHRSSLEPNDR
jgi:SAM-dependent methyltransferase